MYYHVLENVQRDGKPAYLHTKTYRRWGMLMRHLIRPECKPVWVVQTACDYLPVHDGGLVGGYGAAFEDFPNEHYWFVRSWNAASGWGWSLGDIRGQMPKLPLAIK